MNKVQFFNDKFSYAYDATHKGAPYIVNGRHCNAGQLAEALFSGFNGYGFKFDKDAVPFDRGSDVGNYSVKSSGASLACLYGLDKAAILDEYFARVYSTAWVYVVQLDDMVYFYTMNAEEFRAFAEEWAGLTRESGKEIRYKVRFKKTSSKMLQWLDERVG